MKKWAYLLSGVVIGAVVATSGSAFAAQVQSLIGQKVTGELNVIVNGKALATKGSVINNTTNAPVRAVAEAIGGTVSLQGDTVTITTDSDGTTTAPVSDPNNQYIGRSKESLLKSKANLENDILAPTIKGRDELLTEMQTLKSAGAKDTDYSVQQTQKQLDDYDAMITKYQAELDLVNEALAALN